MVSALSGFIHQIKDLCDASQNLLHSCYQDITDMKTTWTDLQG